MNVVSISYLCNKQEPAYAAKPTMIISVTFGDYLKRTVRLSLELPTKITLILSLEYTRLLTDYPKNTIK